MFTEAQNTALSAPLSSAHVLQRNQGGRKVSYVEGWHAIAEANRIFGFDMWDRETLEMKCVSERERAIGQDKAPGWGVSYIARVRVTVRDAEGFVSVTREGYGTGHGIDRDLGQAHESALKEAETDAMKRALMTFGNPFGLALYDKKQENVEKAAPPAPKAAPKANGNGREKTNVVPLDPTLSAEKAAEMLAEIAKIVTPKGVIDYATKNLASFDALTEDDQQKVRKATMDRKAELNAMAAMA
jgi:DNA recombination protein Rad52